MIQEGYIVRDPDDGLYRFWNGLLGWVKDVRDATYYTPQEYETVGLPEGERPHWVPISRDGRLK